MLNTLHLFNQKYSKNSNIVKYNYNLKGLFSIWIDFRIYSCDEFSASLLQSSVSHDLSEIILKCWFAAQERFIIIICVETSCSTNIFVETLIIWWWRESSKQHLFELEIFLINSVHPCWIKVWISLKNIFITDPKLLNGSFVNILMT